MTVPSEFEEVEHNLPLVALDKLSRDVRKGAALIGQDEARFIVGLYYNFQKNRIALSHQKRTLEEAEKPSEVVTHFAVQMAALEAQMRGVLDSYSDASVVGLWSKAQLGIGPVLAAGLLAHIDIAPHGLQLNTVAPIWRFAGLDPTVKWGKGEKRPWNADLKLLCVRPDCLVTTSAGPKRIDEIVVGDEVLTHEGRWRPVQHVYVNYHDGPIYGLGTGTNRRAWLTAGHPVFAAQARVQRWADSMRGVTRSKVKGHAAFAWVPVERLEPGSLLTIPSLPVGRPTTMDFTGEPGAILIGDSVVSEGRWKGTPAPKGIAMPARVDVDAAMAYWLGLYASEGHVSGNLIGLSFHIDEVDLQERARKGLARFGCDSSIVRNEPKRSAQVIAARHLLASWLVENMGAGSLDAKVPDVILHATDDIREAFLMGVWAGDGDHRSDEFIITTSSALLARGLAAIDPRLTVHQAVQPSGQTYFKLRRRKTFPTRSRWASIGHFAGPVYNLEVEEDHSYVVEGIAVHNCWKIGDCFVKVSGREHAVYGQLYKQRKAYEVERNDTGGNEGRAFALLAEKANASAERKAIWREGKLPPGHIDLQARRWCVKIFLAHWFQVAYEDRWGVAPPLPYPIAILGHADPIPVPPGGGR